MIIVAEYQLHELSYSKLTTTTSIHTTIFILCKRKLKHSEKKYPIQNLQHKVIVNRTDRQAIWFLRLPLLPPLYKTLGRFKCPSVTNFSCMLCPDSPHKVGSDQSHDLLTNPHSSARRDYSININDLWVMVNSFCPTCMDLCGQKF